MSTGNARSYAALRALGDARSCPDPLGHAGERCITRTMRIVISTGAEKWTGRFIDGIIHERAAGL